MCQEAFAEALHSVGRGRMLRLNAGETVQQAALLRLVKGAQGLRLRVDEGEFGRKLAQNADGRWLVVDEDSALPAGGDFAAQQNLRALHVDPVLFQDGFGTRGGLEDAGDDGFFCTVADHVAGRALAHKQRQRIDQDRFAGSGFAGQEVESRSERGNGMVDDCVVFCAQLQQHPAFLACSAARLGGTPKRGGDFCLLFAPSIARVLRGGSCKIWLRTSGVTAVAAHPACQP